MARPYRLQGENCFYHITSRGDNRKNIFISDYDFEKFLEYLQLAKDKYKFNLYAYCLMSNHYHLFLETLQPNLSKIMQYINTAYTVYYNKKRNKTGHLFQGRFKSLLVDQDSYFLELTRYIHLNPVKAKIVDLPQKYKWSSFKGYIKPKTDKYIDYPELNSYLPMKPSHYKDFVLNSIGKKDTLFDSIYAGFFLGGKDFIEDKLAKFKSEIDSGDFAHKRKLQPAISIDDIISVTGKIFKEDKESTIAKKHSHSFTRKIVIFITRKATPLTNKQIGEYFNISDSAVTKAGNIVEASLKESKQLKRKLDGILLAFRV
ncbi:MAG: transposase [Candidatus Omnitrophica bacterium]|nr:transposase [Candidatus Omnitrophota bacterium]